MHFLISSYNKSDTNYVIETQFAAKQEPSSILSKGSRIMLILCSDLLLILYSKLKEKYNGRLFRVLSWFDGDNDEQNNFWGPPRYRL